MDQILSDNQIPKDGCFAMTSIVPMTEPIFASIIIAIISLIIIWAIVSVPVWISAKIITSGRARFGRMLFHFFIHSGETDNELQTMCDP